MKEWGHGGLAETSTTTVYASGCKQKKPVCKPCRAQGFHPHDLHSGATMPECVHGALEETSTTTAKASGCKRGAERDTAWKNCLTSNGHGCSACKNELDASSWSQEKVRDHRKLGRDLVCPRCSERGYAPVQYDDHQCEECLEKFGPLKFDMRKNAGPLKFERRKPKLPCSKCKTLLYWHRYQRKNHLGPRKTKLVCKACRAQGFHPDDLKTYKCQTCACEFGAHKINKNQLHHFKYHQRKKLRCMQCAAAAEERVRQLHKQLRKSKRKCTCHCRIHQKKCPLTPVIFGEMRWPGSDGAISADDRKFLDELNPPPDWWRKAWGPVKRNRCATI